MTTLLAIAMQLQFQQTVCILHERLGGTRDVSDRLPCENREFSTAFGEFKPPHRLRSIPLSRGIADAWISNGLLPPFTCRAWSMRSLYSCRDFGLSSSLPVPTFDRSPLESRPLLRFLVLHVAPRDIGSYGRRVCLLRLHFFFPFFSAQTACSF